MVPVVPAMILVTCYARAGVIGDHISRVIVNNAVARLVIHVILPRCGDPLNHLRGRLLYPNHHSKQGQEETQAETHPGGDTWNEITISSSRVPIIFGRVRDAAQRFHARSGSPVSLAR